MYPTVIDRFEAASVIARWTGIKPGTPSEHLADQIIAEYLRHALCSLGQGRQPVYVTRLTNAIQRHLAPLWPELYVFRARTPVFEEQAAKGDIHPDRVRRVLNILADLRDFVELGEGYWLPAPVRLVSLPGSERVLVVGGISTSDLRRRLHAGVELVGFARVLSGEAVPAAVQHDLSKWQSYEAWCGDVPLNLKEWTEAHIEQAQGQLRKSAGSFFSFEVYAPWLRRNQPQFYRWMRFEDFFEETRKPPRTLLLCRSMPQWFQGSRKYWLGITGSTGLEREAPIPSDHARRLMYGMDLLYQAPTRAVWEDGKTLVLRNRLPPEEQRILIASSREVSSQPGRLPLCLEIGRDWFHFVNERLVALGIEIVSQQGEGT